MAKTQMEVVVQGTRGALQMDCSFSTQASWTVIFGASGSGKSSLLRAIAGLWRPAIHRVVLRGEALQSLPAHRRQIAMVSQQASLFPHLTAEENIRFPNNGADVASLLATVHATAFANSFPATLSGGEQQRVALARALASKPRLLLLDEAFSGMGAPLRSELVATLKQWQSQHGVPILSVTHDVVEAMECADDAVVMEAGRIVHTGPPAEALRQQRLEALQRLTNPN